ncbi:hypothetical protein [Mycobacterium marinum]|uniref:hypothetical protein n=1 Tax=Mycobacterium marinum TaxID=1781 RepID=UPI00115D7CEB|nr:hypothetical protein [Mycobacterium marinum]
MPSDALIRWQDERSAVLDSLEAIHEQVTGKRRGRQTATEHLNLALFVRLAAEFQGYCRDLHDDAAIVIADSLADEYAARIPVLLSALVRGRKLDVGNAGPGNIGNDFANLGMSLWPDVCERYRAWGPKWNQVLERLNKVRNAIAHSDAAALDEVKRLQPLTLATFRRWRGSLNTAASGFDKVVAAYLSYLTGAAPWN